VGVNQAGDIDERRREQLAVLHQADNAGLLRDEQSALVACVSGHEDRLLEVARDHLERDRPGLRGDVVVALTARAPDATGPASIAACARAVATAAADRCRASGPRAVVSAGNQQPGPK